jgi:hypothetical protein
MLDNKVYKPLVEALLAFMDEKEANKTSTFLDNA